MTSIHVIAIVIISAILSVVSFTMGVYTSTIALGGYQEFLKEQIFTRQEFADNLVASDKKFAEAKILKEEDIAEIHDQINKVQLELDDLKKKVNDPKLKKQVEHLQEQLDILKGRFKSS